MSTETDFERWFDSFEGDGGELLLYNTLDLEAAFLAGRKDGLVDAEIIIFNNQMARGSLSEARAAIRQRMEGE